MEIANVFLTGPRTRPAEIALGSRVFVHHHVLTVIVKMVDVMIELRMQHQILTLLLGFPYVYVMKTILDLPVKFIMEYVILHVLLVLDQMTRTVLFVQLTTQFPMTLTSVYAARDMTQLHAQSGKEPAHQHVPVTHLMSHATHVLWETHLGSVKDVRIMHIGPDTVGESVLSIFLGITVTYLQEPVLPRV